MVLLAVPKKYRLAQPGARGDDGGMTSTIRLAAGVQHALLLGGEVEHAVTGSLQIVEQFHPLRANGPRQHPFVQVPGQVRGVAFPVEDRTGHAEAARSQR
jgi:hypothetical protein